MEKVKSPKRRRFLIFLLIGGVLLWLSTQSMNRKELAEIEIVSFSKFRHMLEPEGRKTVGIIVSRPDLTVRPGPLAFLGNSQTDSFILRILPKEIRGRYLHPDQAIEPSDDVETLKARSIPFKVISMSNLVTEELLENLEKNKIAYEFVNEEEGGFWSSFISILPIVVIVLLLWFFMMRQLQNTGNRAMSFGKSRARLAPDKGKKVSFGDVAGCNESKVELAEVVDFLKDPKKFQKIGAKIPRGILMVGAPGTGKTLLARAVAGESKVPFFSISGSDFVEMFVGVGASRVRDLFENAKKHAPCIVFIDEIDAVGRLRGAGLGGGHDEREQTLNQILVEMDGFEENQGVIIIAATNRADVLDPALLRPGRFDRQIMVDVPDLTGRNDILKIHSKKIPLEESVDLRQIAQGTPGFTGADLANLINEAALLSARNSKEKVGQAALEEARDKVMMGPERKSFFITEKEKEIIAYHEAGHALLGYILPHSEPVHKVTIIPRGRALGITQSLPQEDLHLHASRYWEDRICLLMGGYLAESIQFRDTSTGASNDIQVATRIARQMVCEWGMSDKIGTIAYSNEGGSPFLGRDMAQVRHYSDITASTIDQEIHRIIEHQRGRARNLIISNKEKLNHIAQALLANETINGEQLKAIMEPVESSAGSSGSTGVGSAGSSGSSGSNGVGSTGSPGSSGSNGVGSTGSSGSTGVGGSGSSNSGTSNDDKKQSDDSDNSPKDKVPVPSVDPSPAL